jgi:predicted  nucleic acid-binding Zn-ribbon protein
MWDTAQMTMTNLTANKSRTQAHAQAAEAAMEFVPPQAIEALKNAQALQDAHDDMAAQLATTQAELAAEKEAHATTQAALDAATKTPE